MLIFLGNSAFIYAIWSCVKNVCPFDNPVTFEFCNIHIIFLNGLTKGTLSYLILTTQWIHVNWCQILVILLAILLQCISKDNTASWFSTSVVFIMSPVVSELTVISHYMLLFYVSDSDISLNRFLLSAFLRSKYNNSLYSNDFTCISETLFRFNNFNSTYLKQTIQII